MDGRTIWDWLDIEETRDKALIRKAYARQAKKYHPEDMPKEAEQLRKAYKTALALAERYKDTGVFRQADTVFREEQETQREERTVPPEKKEDTYRYQREEKKEEQEVSGDQTEDGHLYLYQREEKKEEQEVSGDQTEDGHLYLYQRGEKKETQKIPPKSTENRYRYHLDTPGKEYKMPRGSGHFDHFHFDSGRTGRLELLEKRLNNIYYSGKQSNFEFWSDILRECLTAEDLKDTKVVAAILSILIEMRRLSHSVWDVLEQELFRFGGEGAEWIWLQTQFYKMREEDTLYKNLNASAKQGGSWVPQVDPITGKIIPKEHIPGEVNEIVEVLLGLLGVLAFIAILYFTILR